MLKERKLNIAPAIKKQVKSPKKDTLHCDKSGQEMSKEGGSKNNLMICNYGLLANCNSYL